MKSLQCRFQSAYFFALQLVITVYTLGWSLIWTASILFKQHQIYAYLSQLA